MPRPVRVRVLFLALDLLRGLSDNAGVDPRVATTHVEHVIVQSFSLELHIVCKDDVRPSIAELAQFLAHALHLHAVGVVQLERLDRRFLVLDRVLEHKLWRRVHQHPAHTSRGEQKDHDPVKRVGFGTRRGGIHVLEGWVAP